MRQMKGFSLGALAIAIAATAMFATVAPSGAIAGTSAHPRTAHNADYPRYRAYREYGAGPTSAYGAIPGGSGFARPSYQGYGYGYGDNSHGCSACTN
jgi:hypothetical protein